MENHKNNPSGFNKIKVLVAKDHPQRQEIKIEITPLFNVCKASWTNKDTKTREHQYFVLDKGADPDKLFDFQDNQIDSPHQKGAESKKQNDGVAVYLETVFDFCSETPTNYREYFWDCVESFYSNTISENWSELNLPRFILFQAKTILREYLKSNNLENLSHIEIIEHFKQKESSKNLFDLYLVLITNDDPLDDKIKNIGASPDSKIDINGSFNNILSQIEPYRNDTTANAFKTIDAYQYFFLDTQESQEVLKLIDSGLFLVYISNSVFLEAKVDNQELSQLLNSISPESRINLVLECTQIMLEVISTKFKSNKNIELSKDPRKLDRYIFNFYLEKLRQYQSEDRFEQIANIIANQYPEAKNIAVEKSRYRIPNIAEATRQEDSTYVRYFVINKFADPEILCDNPNLKYLKTAYEFFKENIPDKTFEEFFWNVVENNFTKLFDYGSSPNSMVYYSTHMATIALNQYLRSVNLEYESDEAILKHFSRGRKNKDLAPIYDLLEIRKKFAEEELKKQAEKRILDYAIQKALTSYKDLIKNITQYQQEIGQEKLGNIDMIKYYFGSSIGITTKTQFEIIRTGADTLCLFNSALLQGTITDPEISYISANMTRHDLIKVILAITSKSEKLISKSLDTVKHMDEESTAKETQEMKSKIYSLFVSTLKKFHDGENLYAEPEPKAPEIPIDESHPRFVGPKNIFFNFDFNDRE